MTQCWVLTEGMIGTQNQCVALAEAAGYMPIIKTISLKNPWKFFTPWLRFFSPSALAPHSSPLQAPWPDIVIASGRKVIAAALWIKQQSGGKTKLVIVQSPIIKSSHFDLVVAPHHDRYKGENTLPVLGALSVITPEALDQARLAWQGRLERYTAPYLAVMIGGNTRKYMITEDIARHLAHELKRLNTDYSLLVTTSRRTPDNVRDILKRELQGDRIFFWDNQGDNPYRAFLASASALLVTEDSVSMISEAISTGKPVYMIKLEGKSRRFERFYRLIVDKDYARWFTGRIENWSYPPPDDLKRAATAVNALLAQRTP